MRTWVLAGVTGQGVVRHMANKRPHLQMTALQVEDSSALARAASTMHLRSSRGCSGTGWRTCALIAVRSHRVGAEWKVGVGWHCRVR